MLAMSCLFLLHALQTASPQRRQWWRRRPIVNLFPHDMHAGTAASGTHLGAKPPPEPLASAEAGSALTASVMAVRHARATSAEDADTTNDFFGVLIWNAMDPRLLALASVSPVLP
jgi:hypothetical protein